MKSSENPPAPQSSYPTLIGVIGIYYIRRLWRALGRGRFVLVFLHPGALPNAFVSSCACWHLWVSLWHFARPCGVSLALWMALGLHCGTLAFHFDTRGWGIVGSLLGTLGRPCGFISAPLSCIWVPLGSMLVSCGHFGVWPWTPGSTFVEKALKSHPKWKQEWTHFV